MVCCSNNCALAFANEDTRYHHLNHFAMFGGGYRGGAMSIMKRLISKYAG